MGRGKKKTTFVVKLYVGETRVENIQSLRISDDMAKILANDALKKMREDIAAGRWKPEEAGITNG
ncbi:MAG: hypothetical protein VB111_03145 [Clostridiaceae bacterium]|nr:hypothetical protein [Clostridiaceae bacterium]